MSRATSGQPAASPGTLSDLVCTGCACLCDDIALERDGERIIEARNACEPGRSRFVDRPPVDGSACLIDGQPAAFDQAIDRAARILVEAHAPVIFGLGSTTIEAQRAAVTLAESVGAFLDVASGGDATVDALQTVGEATCTLGEIRNRADLILIWRADPESSHPRLLSRYALDPAGLFVPGGRGDRFCVVVDTAETTTVREAADQYVPIDEDAEIEALWTLRALAKGITLDPSAVESGTGVPLETWQTLVDRMKSARYGAVFYGAARNRPAHERLIARGIHSLTRDLNATTRFVCMPLPRAGNGVGARNVLGWRTGYPGSIRLSDGRAQYGPGEFTADLLLGRRETDAALIASADGLSNLPGDALEHLARIPTILLSSDRPSEGSTLQRPSVHFRNADWGIECRGTAYRMDGVPLPVRPARHAGRPSDEEVLQAIERRVRSLATEARRREGSD